MIEHALGTLYPRLERRGFTAFFSASTTPAEKKSCVWKRCPATDTLPAGRFPCFGSTWRSPSNFTCTRNFASSFLRKEPCTISFPRTTSTWISSVPRKTGASHRLLTASSSRREVQAPQRRGERRHRGRHAAACRLRSFGRRSGRMSSTRLG